LPRQHAGHFQLARAPRSDSRRLPGTTWRSRESRGSERMSCFNRTGRPDHISPISAGGLDREGTGSGIQQNGALGLRIHSLSLNLRPAPICQTLERSGGGSLPWRTKSAGHRTRELAQTALEGLPPRRQARGPGAGQASFDPLQPAGASAARTWASGNRPALRRTRPSWPCRQAHPLP